ncbi:sterol desaturase family protein [Rufibacter hautae]|uniref:Sterol desaturase family protein n=1 Tax=Rufibacter hautae TaxID=2595005 RepID=A0A5B6T9Y8_9BACT|nr:sterol desaturase family protein [Rufibacter hautae]KAA3436370.1 sterol desaturase family protein [Rufibacter hautae]
MKKEDAFSLFQKVGMPVLGGWALFLFWKETTRALRSRKQPRTDRLVMNGKVAATAAVGLRLMLIPALVGAATYTQKRQIGLLPRLPLPQSLKTLVAFLLLDYGNYLWHTLNHRFSVLWRFHNVHHTDLDLDITTAWRFHLGEVAISALYRGGVAGLVGTTPGTVLLYELFYEGATAFHHSNWQLPYQVEKALSKVVVTPRMHGIHHSIVLRETNSNYSVVFSFWDRLHQTLRLNVPQQEITIGVPAYQEAEELTYANLLRLPFTSIRSWKLPSGEEPDRPHIKRPIFELAR